MQTYSGKESSQTLSDKPSYLSEKVANLNNINFIAMKKISLKNLNLKEVEQLSREQLIGVLGGFAGGTSGELNEYAKACQGKADGSTCMVTINGNKKTGYCRYALTGPLVCFV